MEALKELETDRGLGNVGEEEYAFLRSDYERQAATVLKALDAHSEGVSEEIERLVALERGKAVPQPDVAGETRMTGNPGHSVNPS